MAILYGTQSNGETLPVLVDQFGNLLAKGIEGETGPPGPEGPPGVGQLPPNPYEGAILGWENGELSWLGGSVILPAGTYGPYTYIEGDERLDIPQDASSLVNGQQLFMSDADGHQIVVGYQTDNIANVGILGAWNQTQYWQANLTSNNWYSVNTSDQVNWLFDGADNTAASFGEAAGGYLECTFTNLQVNSSVVVHLNSPYGNANPITLTIDGVETTQLLNNAAGERFCTFNVSGSFDKIKIVSNTTYITCSSISVDGKRLVNSGVPGDPGAGSLLTFPTSNNFDKFEVGDVVQDPDTSIISISATAPKIEVSGGSWSGSDGSGSGGSRYLETSWSGEGSVFTGTDGAILLRNNNKEWADDFYVTAPEQRIAARKAAANARKLRKK
jgi:hypothetical protein